MEIPMIDWLSVTVDIKDYEKNIKRIIDDLEYCKKLAIEKRSELSSEKVCYQIENELFEVLPNGTSTYAFILNNNQISLKLSKYRSKNDNNYPIFVHFRSAFLWEIGPENAWYWFVDWIGRNLGQVTRDKLNRVDLCCHTDSIKFVRDDEERFKGRYVNERASRSNREFTGFEFGSRGSGTIFARIYNKSKEVEIKKEKLWFNCIWENKGLNINNVWNIEFELKREIFKQMGIESCDDLFRNMKSIWDYLTVSWLVMIDLNSDRLERCKTVKEWKVMQKAFDAFESKNLINRERQISCNRDALILSAMGYMTSFSAISDIKEPKESISKMLDEGLEMYIDRGKDYKKIVELKRRLLGY